MKAKRLERGSGILMPISALPGKYGIGTMGKNAYEFVDFAASLGFKYWQVLPVGPTSYGDSPYQSFSAFAGNPYFIDFEVLIEEGLLEEGEAEKYFWGELLDDIDYAAVYHSRFEVLKLAFGRSNHREQKEYQIYEEENQYWLEDYAFYMAVKFHFESHQWLLWDEDIRLRKPEAVKRYQSLLKEDIEFWKFCQFKFREQWLRLKTYTNDKGLQVIGDIPLYVAMDSSDVWVHRDLFELDKDGLAINIAGVPPDAFSDDGQRWGNPLYLWDVMEQNDFVWWRERMKANASLYDVIRIDHFIGIVNFWSIDAACPTAIDGEWRKGPGENLIKAIEESIGEAKIIAEDLGVPTKPVIRLIEKSGFPGMKVLLFGLEGDAASHFLPHNYNKDNIVAYIGTHDNDTLVGYLKRQKRQVLRWIKDYYDVRTEKELPKVIIRSLYGCVADVVILQMQDLLGLDNSGRTNMPSTVGINWRWRMQTSQYEELDADYYHNLCLLYNR